MTKDDYELATSIIHDLKIIDSEIENLKTVLNQSPSHWEMLVRRSCSYKCIEIRHCGMLKGFLENLLNQFIEERKKLSEELAKI